MFEKTSNHSSTTPFLKKLTITASVADPPFQPITCIYVNYSDAGSLSDYRLATGHGMPAQTGRSLPGLC